jgi:hypothetical protein
MAIPTRDQVVARYGSLYPGDDELAANCLIKRTASASGCSKGSPRLA